VGDDGHLDERVVNGDDHDDLILSLSQGFYGSAIFFTTAAGRCTGPIAAGYLLETVGRTYLPVYMGLLAITLVSVVSLPFVWRAFANVEAAAAGGKDKAFVITAEENLASAAALLGAETEEPFLSEITDS
jgi:hypothetical protein